MAVCWALMGGGRWRFPWCWLSLSLLLLDRMGEGM